MSRPVQPSSRGRTTIASEPSGAKIVTVCGAIVSKRYYETFRLNGYSAEALRARAIAGSRSATPPPPTPPHTPRHTRCTLN